MKEAALFQERTDTNISNLGLHIWQISAMFMYHSQKETFDLTKCIDEKELAM